MLGIGLSVERHGLWEALHGLNINSLWEALHGLNIHTLWEALHGLNINTLWEALHGLNINTLLEALHGLNINTLLEALHGLNINTLYLNLRYETTVFEVQNMSMSQSLSLLAHLEMLLIERKFDDPCLWEALHSLNIKDLHVATEFGCFEVFVDVIIVAPTT
ncbi:hypothetical protein DPMN_097050 [Dreissena polymorpha]|uniref:Uncharacterized protein n=1 Tax=Dreissena polymorpha TaxID=45954 RepID=A0A9D4R5C3_DREPO|nr:hypothetical protein DPMN_097050 [Dreissena polymorpha]